MPSIIGQTMQGAGPTLGAIGSSLGNFFSPSSASAATVPSPPSPTTYDPYTATDFPATSIVPADGGAAPAPTNTDPAAALASGLANAFADPSNAAAINAGAGGTAAAPTDWMTTLGNWLKGDVSGAKGALGSPISALGTLGNVIEAYNRWQTMKTLQNPAALASGASQLYQPMSKALKRNIIAPVTAAAQETGQINAPGLYSQSVASALAPYQYQMQMNALNEYIRALQESGGAYPQGGMFGGGLVPQGIYGGSGTTTAAGQ